MSRRQVAVVTGAGGFLGSHLSDRLLAEGWKVIGLDNFLTGDRRNIDHLGNEQQFELIEHNVCEEIRIEGEVDYVFHLASPASPVDYLEHPIPTLKVGALGTHRTLGLALAKKARFFLTSTSEVYGDPLIHPQHEEYWGNVNPVGPRGVYDEAKRFAEAMTMAYHRSHNLSTRIVRIFNTYGPRMRLQDGRVVPTFLSEALQGRALTVYGDGTQTRSFCYVSDLIEGFWRLALSEVHDPVNIGNPKEMTINEFAEVIRDIINPELAISYHPLPVDDPKVRQPDISKAKRLLGWEPKVDLSTGLKKTIEAFLHSGAFADKIVPDCQLRS